MCNRDTPGDEIALHILSRMYMRHSVVVTSMKLWSTIKTEGPLQEDELMAKCDLRFLFIEPGVYGELKLKPTLPPAPPKPVFESATDIIYRDKKQVTDQQVNPLNLSVVDEPAQTKSTETVIGDNSNSKGDIGDNGPIKGTDVPVVSTNDLSITSKDDIVQEQEPVDSTNNINEAHVSAQQKDDANSLVETAKCTVKLTRLNDDEIDKWMKAAQEGQDSGIEPTPSTEVSNTQYDLRERKRRNSDRPDRDAKQHVQYTFSSDYSSDDASVRCNKKRRQNKYPLRGPSAARMAAQAMILGKQNELPGGKSDKNEVNTSGYSSPVSSQSGSGSSSSGKSVPTSLSSKTVSTHNEDSSSSWCSSCCSGCSNCRNTSGISNKSSSQREKSDNESVSSAKSATGNNQADAHVTQLVPNNPRNFSKFVN